MPLVIAGATSGSTTVQATDAVTATITLPSATTTLVGATTPSFTTTIGVGGATPSASGAGITFPATQSASTDANTLDDYEEGTWTPNNAGGFTVVGAFSSGGRYVKTGAVVYVEGFVAGATSVAFLGSTATLISTLPFSGGTSYSAVGSAANSTGTASATISSGSTSIYSITAMAATPAIYFSLTYRVA
jgi:hypothetical protein